MSYKFLKPTAAEFTLLGALMLVFLGSSEVIGAFGKIQMLDAPDPLLGLVVRRLLLLYGVGQLVAAAFILFTSRRILGLALTGWLAAIFLVYRIGLWSIGWHDSSGLIIAPLGFSISNMDLLSIFLSIYLVATCYIPLRGELRKISESQSMKIPCPSCGGRIKFAIQDLGRHVSCPHCQKDIALRAPDFVKMFCFFCKGHIEFPPYAAGKKMRCPHCDMDITLKESR
jgi:hypothetical protein